MKHPYKVIRTAFHGGGIVSSHSRLDLAHKALKKQQRGDCVCGCVGIVNFDTHDRYYTCDAPEAWQECEISFVVPDFIPPAKTPDMHFSILCL